MNFRSAFSQIVWLQVLTVVATALVMPAAIFLFLDRIVATYQVQMLRQHEQVLLRGLTPAGGSLSLPPKLLAAYAQGIDGFAFSILDASGRPLLSSLDSHAALAAPPTGPAVAVFRRKTPEASYFGASFPERVGGVPIWIQVGQNLENPDVVLDDVMARFLPQVGWLSAALLVLVLAADIVIVRRALKPILHASQMAEAISPARIDVRLPSDRVPSEIKPLIEAVNQAFDRLEHGFRALRELTADVAHELNTPLAVLRLRVEALSDAGARSRLTADIDVMSRMVSQLLAIAELENVVIDPADRADLRQVCLEVVELLAPLAVDEGKELELSGPEAAVWVRGNHDFLFQAVRNLVENGLAHTPAATAVTVGVEAEGQVRVLDRGPGVPPALREMLFQRFWRRRDRSSKAGAGAGLGLSIVARIAGQVSGTVSVGDRPGGGAMFVLTLRPAEAPVAGSA